MAGIGRQRQRRFIAILFAGSAVEGGVDRIQHIQSVAELPLVVRCLIVDFRCDGIVEEKLAL